MSGSVSFDRAAEYYDQTRGLSEDGVGMTTQALAAAFDGAGPILEIGVGTGQIALPLHAAGMQVVGLDLSRPMLAKLLAKADGAPPFPLLEADATRMPLPDDAFGGAYLRWVLHLIPDWRAAVAEVARVVEPGGLFLAGLGSYGGMGSEIQERFAELTGVSTDPAGLTWDGWNELDALVDALGGEKLSDISIEALPVDDVETFVRGIEGNRYSWTWAVGDDALRHRAAALTRAWAEDRWGPLERVPREPIRVTFAAYRLG